MYKLVIIILVLNFVTFSSNAKIKSGLKNNFFDCEFLYYINKNEEKIFANNDSIKREISFFLKNPQKYLTDNHYTSIVPFKIRFTNKNAYIVFPIKTIFDQLIENNWKTLKSISKGGPLDNEYSYIIGDDRERKYGHEVKIDSCNEWWCFHRITINMNDGTYHTINIDLNIEEDKQDKYAGDTTSFILIKKSYYYSLEDINNTYNNKYYYRCHLWWDLNQSSKKSRIQSFKTSFITMYLRLLNAYWPQYWKFNE